MTGMRRVVRRMIRKVDGMKHITQKKTENRHQTDCTLLDHLAYVHNEELSMTRFFSVLKLRT